MLAFLRPFRRAVVVSLFLSCFAIVGTVAIPLLLGETVDAIQSGDRDSRASARARDRRGRDCCGWCCRCPGG